MLKSNSELPADIAARLDQVVEECLTELRRKVAHIFRFANMDEIEAAMIVLAEKGEPLHLNMIVEEMKGGGIWRPATGSKGSSADTEMKRSIGRAAAHGVNLKFVDRDKEIIGRADWAEKEEQVNR